MRNIPPAWLWVFAACLALEILTTAVVVRVIW